MDEDTQPTEWGVPDVLLLNSDVRQAFPFLLPLGILGVWRWTLYFLRIVFWLCYKPIPPTYIDEKEEETEEEEEEEESDYDFQLVVTVNNSFESSISDTHISGGAATTKESPTHRRRTANKFQSTDVSIVVPTIDNGEEFLLAAKQWIKNEPKEIIIVTSKAMQQELSKTVEENFGGHQNLFQVLSVEKPNKRVQMVAGIQAARGEIVALSDDDAVWTDAFLDWSLAPFDDDAMGGVGSKQGTIPVGAYKSVWEVIADCRLTMRMIETSATTFVDGGMSCLSGRTAVYRTSILKDPEFQHQFQNETWWRGKYHLHSGDDKFITRWLVKNCWKMRMQNHKDCMLWTTFKNNSNFLKQVLRWTRNTWRSDFKSIFCDHKILWRHPYVAFNMFDKFINPLPMLWAIVVIIGNLITNGAQAFNYVVLPVAGLRFLPHMIENPVDIPYIPSMILFQYYFVFAKVYCLFTLHVTDWGSRPTVATEDDAKKAIAAPSSKFEKQTEPDVENDEMEARLGIMERYDVDDIESAVGSSHRMSFLWNGDGVEVDLQPPEDSTENSNEDDLQPSVVSTESVFESHSMVWTGDAVEAIPSSESESLFRSTDREDVSDSSKGNIKPGPFEVFVPWYKRPAVWIGFSVMSLIIAAYAMLGIAASRHTASYWAFTEIYLNKSLSSDRATGAGLYDPVAHKTFLTFAGSNVDPFVVEYDHASKNYINNARIAFAQPGRDFHDYPRLVLADDGKLVAVYTDSPGLTNKGNPGTLHVTKAQNNHTSIGVWNDRLINEDQPTYPCLIKASSGDIYTFYRSRAETDYRPIHYVKSIDNGETWSDPINAIDTLGLSVNRDPYNLNEVYFDCPRRWPATDLNPERFAFGWTLAGGGPGVRKHNNYHKDAHFAFFLPGGDTWTTVNGTNLGGLVDYYELPSTLMYNSGPLDKNNRRIVDYYFAPSRLDGTPDYPMVIFNFNRTLISSRWNGTDWERSVVLKDSAYNLFDLEKTGPFSYTLYIAQGAVFIMTSYDGGVNWQREHRIRPVDGSSVSKVILIENYHPDIRLVCHENNWTNYFDVDLETQETYYDGSFKIWTLTERTTNPVGDPYHPKTKSVVSEDTTGFTVPFFGDYQRPMDLDEYWTKAPTNDTSVSATSSEAISGAVAANSTLPESSLEKPSGGRPPAKNPGKATVPPTTVSPETVEGILDGGNAATRDPGTTIVPPLVAQGTVDAAVFGGDDSASSVSPSTAPLAVSEGVVDGVIGGDQAPSATPEAMSANIVARPTRDPHAEKLTVPPDVDQEAYEFWFGD
ncbi:MAG: hypothetical protein SGILL_004659 [Bacillariaceae sp.]